jgi:hypothetical protein
LVQSAGAAGGVVGGLAVSLWGGLKRRVDGVLAGHIWMGLAGQLLLGLGRALPVWLVANFMNGLAAPLVNGSNQAIWQAKVAPDVQGRVFAARTMIAWVTNPVTPILAGLLADYVTEPAMQSQTWLAGAFGWLVGTSPGSGMALQFILTGFAYIATVLIVYFFFPVVRNLEDLLPDHDQMEKLVKEPIS